MPTLAPTASPFGSPTPAGKSVTFTTPGVDSNWSGVAWSTLPAGSPLLLADPGLKVIPWRGGYAAYGSTGGGTKGFLWTSTDGLTWRVVTSFTAQQIVAAASPTGLVAVTGTPDSPSAPQTVWTSTDGVTWHKAGTPTGIGTIDTIAGTSAGLVATGHTLKGTGKSATAQFGVAFSTDGLNWTPVAVGHGIAWDYIGPAVQSGNGRFFVMGGYTGGTASGYRPVLASLTKPGMPGSGALNSGAGTGGLWWSDDGRTWTSASDTAYVSGLDFARDGIEMIWSYRAVPGGTGLQFSSDGGKTWGKSQDPLGDSVCGQGECSTGPDGVIGSNGTYLLAVKSNGKAWVSSDGKTWTSMAWDGSLATGSILVLPRGVVVDGKYGAAK